MIFLFNKTVKTIISSYIPHETVTFDDRDHPWINKKAKQLVLEKNEMYKRYAKENKDPKILEKFKCLQNEPNSIIESNKQKYHSSLSNKLIDSVTSSRVYWSTLKMFLSNKKIPCILSFSQQHKYVTNFKENTEIFNSLFAEQCSLMNDSSKLPSNKT